MREIIAYTVGNGQVNGLHLQDKAGTLNCMHEQQIVLCNGGGTESMIGFDSYNSTVTGDKICTLTAYGEYRSNGARVMNDMIVRRLTPVECERLQGYPDGWTEGEADTQRYKQCGNSVAIPCVEFIMRRIKEVLEDEK